MNILILNGSPRPAGNTAKMIEAFTEGAERAGHGVTRVDVCRKRIAGCLACEYCHTKGNGVCIQQDDMREIYALLQAADMLVLASPIYPDMYVGAKFSYYGDFVDYLQLEGMGMFTSNGEMTEEKLAELRAFGRSLA